MNNRPILKISSHKTGAGCWEADVNSAKLRNHSLIFKKPRTRICCLWLKCRTEQTIDLTMLKLIKKNLHFLGSQNDQTDHKCWLFDSLYEDSWIFSYKWQYLELIGKNAKSVKFSYWDCLQQFWYFWSFYLLKNIYILKVFNINAKYGL